MVALTGICKADRPLEGALACSLRPKAWGMGFGARRLDPAAWGMEHSAQSLKPRDLAQSLEPRAQSLEPGAWCLQPGAWGLELEA